MPFCYPVFVIPVDDENFQKIISVLYAIDRLKFTQAGQLIADQQAYDFRNIGAIRQSGNVLLRTYAEMEPPPAKKEDKCNSRVFRRNVNKVDGSSISDGNRSLVFPFMS